MKNKKQLIIGFVAVLIFLTSTACAHSDGPYRGKVVELETGNPIEGAVVAARWMIEPFVHSEKICDTKETITDKNGEFELPEGSCTSHPFAKMYKPYVVVFKPGYLAYLPIGSSPEEKRAHMPSFTGNEFQDKKQYYIIKLGKPKTREERELTLDEARSLLYITDDEKVFEKLSILFRLVKEEESNLKHK
ncbi:MAG: carboxypeptidase-like regulatory domain-containing protein [Thermodesulfovibrionia bacterium]|nr:carboxypeptidase-like regulatory domain-containing protein [Thermodesulfovibrionia bacterium]